jgi:hypothetical protein
MQELIKAASSAATGPQIALNGVEITVFVFWRESMRDESRIEFGRNRLGFGLPRRISWSAILAGVAVTLGVSLLLALLGAGLGAGSINPMQESHPFEGLGKASMLWLVISGIVSFFAGGWTAGFGSGWVTTRGESAIHGFVTWAVGSILTAALITGAAGSVLSGSAGLIGQTISGGARAASQSPQISAQIREELEKRGIDVNSIQQQAQSPETQAKAEQAARQAGQTVAKGISYAALGGFGMLLLDLISSLLGAIVSAWHKPAAVAGAERAA